MRDGIAVCVTDAQEVMELIGPITLELPAPDSESDMSILDGLNPAERLIVDCLPARAAVSAESVAGAAGLPVLTCLATLGALERLGAVIRCPGGWKRHPNPAPRDAPRH
jgi:DNA processing protein